MATVILEVKEDCLDKTLKLLDGLKDVVIDSVDVESVKLDNSDKEFLQLSNHTLETIWNNKEDAIYDRYVK